MINKKEKGFSLAALIFFSTAASILMAAAVPVYKMQVQRELEEELIFRGEEYVRAIQKYQRKFPGTYPPSIEALLETNGLRFLRRAYRDPITGEVFRLIYINPDGSVTGSTLLQQRLNNAPLFQGGTPQMFGQPQQPSQQPQQPQQRRQQQQSQQPQAQPGQPQAFGTQPLSIGARGLLGVASNSEEGTIRVYNNRQKYNEWEFVFVPSQLMNPGQLPGQAMPGQPVPGQAFPGQQVPGQLMPGQPAPGFPMPGPSLPGQQPIQPFGFGQAQQPIKKN